MKAGFFKKGTALLLALIMTFSLLPAVPTSAAGDSPTAFTPYDSTDAVYAFGEKEYKVLSNGYISCYVSVEDGSFTVLPSASEFDPDKPASHASFRIDGTDWRYGTQDPHSGTVLISPTVENGVMETQWMVGDYVISQIHAIRQEAGRSNAWAVSVGYVVEYFGTGESSLSARVLLDTTLGEQDDLPLLTGNNDEAQLYEALISPVPESLYVNEGEQNKAFLLTNEPDDGFAAQCFPSAIILADFGAMASAAYDVEADTTRAMADNDSGVAIYFGRSVLTEPAPKDETAEAATAIMKVSCGFTDLEFAPAPSMNMLLGTAAIGDSAQLGWEIDPDLFIAPNLPFDVKVGDTVSFRLDFKYPDLMEVGVVHLEYEGHYDLDPDDDQDNHVPVIPDMNGLYSFTVPEVDFVFVSVELLLHDCAILQVYNNSPFSSSLTAKYPLSAERAVVPYGENVTVTVGNVSAGATPGVFLSTDTVFGVPASGAKIGTGQLGDIWEFAITAPAGSKKLDVSVMQTYAHTISTRVFPGGKDVYLNADANYVNGQLRADAGDEIGLSVDDVSGNLSAYYSATAKIVVYEYAGDGSTLTAIETIPYISFGDSDKMKFTMPASNAEVRLELTQLHNINTTMPVSGSPDDAQALGYGNITVLPALPEPGETVKAYINLYQGAILDENVPPTVDGASMTLVNEVTHEYSFTAPPGASQTLTISAGVKIPAEPMQQYSVYTGPLTNAGQVIAGIALSAEIEVTGFGSQSVPIEYTGEAPAGAKITFWPTWNIDEANREFYTHGGTLDFTVETASGTKVADLERIYTPDDPIKPYFYTFTMPAGFVTITAKAWSENRRSFQLEAKHNVMPGVPNSGTPTPDTQTIWFVNGDTYVPAYISGNKSRSKEPIASAGDLIIVGFRQNRGSFFAYQTDNLIITDAGTGQIINHAEIGLTKEGYVSLGAVASKYAAELNEYQQQITTWAPWWGTIALRSSAGTTRLETYELYSYRMPNRDIKLTQTYNQIDAAVSMQVTAPGASSFYSNQQLPANLKITNNSGSNSTRNDLWYVQPQIENTSGSPNPNATVSTEFVLSFEGGNKGYEIMNPNGVSYHFPSNPGQKWTTANSLEVVWRTANAIKYKFSYPVPTASFQKNDIPVFTFRLVESLPFTGMRLYTSSYISEAQNFREISLQGINAGSFNVADLAILTYDGIAIDPSRLTVKSATELVLNMAGIANASDIGTHFLKMSWNVTENGLATTAQYNTQIRLHGPIPPTPPGTAKYLGIIFDPAVTRYELVAAPSQALMASKSAGKQILLSMSCDAGFSSQVIGNETKWTANPVDGKNSGVLFSSGLSTRPCSAGLGGNVSEYFSVSSFYQAPDATPGVTINASAYGLFAEYLPVYVPSVISYKYVMELINGEEYVTNMPVYLQAPDTSKAPVFELQRGDGLLGPCMGIDVLGYGGFRAEYSGIKYLKSGIDLSGELSVQLPEVLTDGAMAGITIENMILNFNSGNLGFDGVRATGEFTMPPFLMLGAVDGNQGFQALIDTFQHQYEFEVELDAKVVQIKGTLKLGVSERLTALNNGGAIIVPDEFYFEFASGYGIPIIPGTEVANINGAKGGFSGLIKTIDFNIDKQTIPPFAVTAGGTFKLLSLIEFDGKFTIGAAKIRTELSMSIDLGGLNVPIFKEYVLEVGARDAQPLKYSLNGNLVNPKRVEIYYYSKIAIELIPEFKIIEGSGSWEAALGMTSPDAWAALAINGQFSSFAEYVTALNLSLSIYGEIAGSLLVPEDVPFIGGHTLLSGTASMYGKASLQENGINLDALRAYAYAEFGVLFGNIGFYALYDFLGRNLDWGEGAGPGSARLFRAGDNALYSERFDGGNGKMTFGNGLVLCADSNGNRSTPMLFAANAAATPSIYVSIDQKTHTVTMPDNGLYLILTDAPKDKLFVYDPNGDAFPLNVMPDVVTTEQAALAYNVIETKDGKLLIGLGGVPGDWTLTSSERFETVVYKSTIAPAKILDVTFGAGSDEITFNLDGLVDGEGYYYDIILQKKSPAAGQVESSILIADKVAFTAQGTTGAVAYSYNLTQLAESAPTGDYSPKIMLYKVNAASTLGYEPVAVGYGYTPYSNINTKYDNATLGLLTNLNAEPGGNATLHVTFTDVVPLGLTETVSYRVAVYDADTMFPALSSIGKEIVIELPASSALPSSKDFYISDLEPGRKYIAEVTPMFTKTMTYTINGSQNDQSITTMGNPVQTSAITIPQPVVPVLTLGTSAGIIANGTVYAPAGAKLTVSTNPGCDIIVKKYVGQSVERSVQNATSLTLDLDGLSGTLITITATNPTTGDSTAEYVNVLVIDAPPPLVVDVNENGVVAGSSGGAYTITGRTNPNAWVASSSGISVRSGPDGSFTMSGMISSSSGKLYLTVNDLAGNSETAAVEIVRGSGDSGGDGVGDWGWGAAPTYTVTFDSRGGSAVAAKFVAFGGALTKPADPMREGYDFTGWYTNAACTVKYDFVSVVTKSFTLYAGWERIGTQTGGTFDDDDGHWAEKYINALAAQGYVRGVGDGKYAPNSPLTRSQFVQILYNAFGEGNTSSPVDPFNDTDPGQWYTRAINWAYAKGLIFGYSATAFGPNDPITREQMAVLIVRAAEKFGIELPNDIEKTEFADDGSIATWAVEAVYAMRQAGIIDGKPGNLFDPQGTLTRGEMAKVMYYLLELAGMIEMHS